MDGISILMSVYAKEQPEFLRQSLRSVLVDQTLPADEMVLVCDGPLTPELDAVIREFESDRLRVHRLPENVGLGEALRIGLEKCRCKWVARADSDDICAPDRFEKQMAYLKQNPAVDVLGAAIDEFESDWRAPSRIKVLPETHAELRRLAKMRCPINHMTVMFRRETILACGSYQPMARTEDYFLWIRAILSGAKLANLPECLVHARVGNGMASRRSSRQYIGSWKKLNDYMLRRRMITAPEYVRNMIAIVGFVFIPPTLKQWVYKRLLRK